MKEKKELRKSKKSRKVLKKDDLLKYINKVETIKKVSFPELQGILKTNHIPCIAIKGASLDDHIQCNSLARSSMVYLSYLLEKIKENGTITPDEIIKTMSEDKIHDHTLFELKLFHKCCVDPKFTYEQVLEIAQKAPEVISRVTNTAIEMTSI